MAEPKMVLLKVSRDLMRNAKFSSKIRSPMNSISKLFQPQNIVPKVAEVKYDDITSKSQKLMLDLGIIRQASTGTFYLLPLGVRSLQKLIRIVDQGMQNLGAQRLLLPLLTSGDLWKTTGRWETAGAELFTLQDRHQKEFVLSPTHEEAITELMASVSQLSYRQLPLRLYQITSKFRDEMKPRFGLLRGKEFLMKDLYTFDSSHEAAMETYERVNHVYDSIFKKIGVRYVKVVGDSGMMGGSISHEYHFPADVGEDQLLICDSCNYGANHEIFQGDSCPVCKKTDMKQSLGIEVGHTFLLGTKYSSPLKATFLNTKGKPELIQMGSYGLGMTRILAAAVESLSLPEEMRWPLSLAPFSICIIPPKEGSKESYVSPLTEQLYDSFNSISIFKNNVVVDDRLQFTIGRRFFDAKRMGYPFIVVIGKKATADTPLFELHDLLDSKEYELTVEGAVEFLKEKANTELEF